MDRGKTVDGLLRLLLSAIRYGFRSTVFLDYSMESS